VRVMRQRAGRQAGLGLRGEALDSHPP
jgi:hypothetical protein